MTFISKFDRYVTAIFCFTILAIIATSYFTLKEFFSSHSQRQQEAIIPLYSLITDEILRPLTISQFMANDQFLINHVEQNEIDKKLILNYMATLADQFNLRTFVALEKHNFMLNNINKTSNLSSKETEWFHRLKTEKSTQIADIGDAEDPHLYFDVKIFNSKNEFIGFTGVAIDLDKFAKSFAQFNKRFGFELLFVDEDGIITLASSDLMNTQSHHRRDELTHISTQPWYEEYLKQTNGKMFCNDCLSDTINHEYIISELPLKELNWRIFIVAPEAIKQWEYWQLFVVKLITFLFVSSVLYLVFTFAVNSFKSALVKSAETDELTQLPNRRFVQWQYTNMLEKHEHVCVVLADLDKFKTINDSYGHLVGDNALKIVAKKLAENLRTEDLVGRWGGEEFILLLPDISVEKAKEVINRIRQNIEKTSFTAEVEGQENPHFTITVSFGISKSTLKNVSLHEIIKHADEALYQAKANGRNQVVVKIK